MDHISSLFYVRQGNKTGRSCIRKKSLWLTALFSIIFLAFDITPAHAAGEKSSSIAEGWYVEAGPARVNFNTSANIEVAGNHIRQAGADATGYTTAALGIGYFFTPEISAILMTGVPPKTKLNGTGVFGGTHMGKVTYGPAVLAVDYHYRGFGDFQPFIGAGFSYIRVFKSEDNAITNLNVDDAMGPTIRAGFEYMLTEHIGMFASVTKIFCSTDVHGEFNGVPVKARVQLDPLITHMGVTYHF
ncbi:OmpW family outer membrane protein [Sodalis sp. dw_96]|uniref:OmpW/AlkL family protein n=1 Tax=Sodalis sp. dw_96 TaxID=2719794 RepID=UPI001BD425CD|nr:OmpW family outer membrane protein [Sodalis sp. dw_96]